ncbi:MAG: hypothetical protein ACLS3B_03645 [Veillonella atypica]|uniref:hypothetical protein n=1 Tax=Veillonella atypica TaxID=39777 RepID=UPI0039953508
MKIKSFATYGVGMDIIYEDILSTGATADLRIKSEDEKSPELYDAWKRMEARVLEYLGKLCQLDTQCTLNVSKIQLRYARETDELESLVFFGSLMAPEAGIGFKTGAIRVNTLFDVMDTKDIGILRELEARIRGYIRGERAQAKFDFSLKNDVEDDYEE